MDKQVKSNWTREEIIADTYRRITSRMNQLQINSHTIQEKAECQYYNDGELLRTIVGSHREAGRVLREYHENIGRPHPYADKEHRRHSASEIVEMVNRDDRICSCGERVNITSELNQPSYPKFPDCESHGDIYTCQSCGRRWEEAYTIVYSMCILKSAPQDS